MKVPCLDLNYQTAAVADDFHKELQELVAANQFIGGKRISDFEEEFASYCGAGHPADRPYGSRSPAR